MISILRESIVLDRLLGVLYRRILIEGDWWFSGLWVHMSELQGKMCGLAVETKTFGRPFN